jgi:hypothetical protein
MWQETIVPNLFSWFSGQGSNEAPSKYEGLLKLDVHFTAVNLSSSDAGDSGIMKC